MKHLYSIVVIAILAVQGSVALAQANHTLGRARYMFGARRHLDTLADRLRREANTVCWEMYYNYQREPGYRTTYREMYKILEDSIHIHNLAHDDVHHYTHHGTDNEDHIAEDLHDIDQLFHHVEDDIRYWSSRNRYHRHDLAYKMERLEITLHHLMEDYGVRSKRPAPKPPGGPPPTSSVPPVIPRP